MVAAVVTNQKAPAEDKQLVKEKKLPVSHFVCVCVFL